ncbi:MAG TPA: DUF3574 domain-containing protein [Longimicrobiaceae bacterium]|nr:DUF3574 domain-containing protein [Longimicrobiaceae bacterium]
MTRTVLALAAVLALSPGCAVINVEAPAAAVAGSSYVRDELYFGLNQRDGGTVSEAEWQAFVDGEITPRFPDGLTVLDAYGQFRADGVIIRERSKVLVLLHRGTAAETRGIQEIIDRYKERFDQSSVLRVTSRARARF